RLRLVDARRGVRLGRGEEGEHSAGELRREPEQLQGGDEPVAAKGGAEPGNAGVRVRPGVELGGEERQIGTRLLDPAIEEPRGAVRACASTPLGAHRAARAGSGVAEAGFARAGLAVWPDLDEERQPASRRKREAP